MAVILTHLRKRDIVFIDDLHCLSQTCSVLLSHAMVTFTLHIESRPKALDLALSPFMLIGATSTPTLLMDSLKKSFTQQIWLREYPD